MFTVAPTAKPNQAELSRAVNWERRRRKNLKKQHKQVEILDRRDDWRRV